MLNFKNILLTLLLILPSVSYAKEIKVTVNGMVCGFCAQGITKKFKENPAIEKVDVNLSSKIVSLITKGETDLDDASIGKTLKDAGYNVEKVERGQ